jgi:hypothetical protein
MRLTLVAQFASVVRSPPHDPKAGDVFEPL